MKAEMNWVFVWLVELAKLFIWQHLIRFYTFFHSLESQLINCFLGNLQGLPHLVPAPSPTPAFFPAQVPLLTFCLHWVQASVFSRSFPCLPPSLARAPLLLVPVTACIIQHYSCLFTCLFPSPDQVPYRQESRSPLCSQCAEQA